MNILYVINTIGLVLDFSGFILIFTYGVPKSVKLKGRGFIMRGGASEEEKDKIKYFDKLSKIGAALIVIGFVLQVIVSSIQIRR